MANDQSQVEIERKYDAAADFVLPDLSDLPGVAETTAPKTILLVANYFDTDDLRLAAHGITLRRRRGGSDAGWHLKLPVGPDSRRELRAPLGRASVVPARLANLIAAYTRGEPLRPIAALETSRTVVRLLDSEGEVLAEIADDAVAGQRIDPGTTAERPAAVEAAPPTAPPTAPAAAPPAAPPTAPAEVAESTDGTEAEGTEANGSEAGAREQALDRVLERANEQAVERSIEASVAHAAEIPPQDGTISAWREIEVELVNGDLALLKAAGKRLRKAGARKAGSASKLARLLGESAPKERAYDATAGTTADTVLAYLTAQRDAILANEPKARLAEPDAVHKTRVAVRRIRSTLKSYGAVLDRKATDPLQPELKWLAAALGEVRDLEVLRMRFTDRLERLSENLPGAATAPRTWLEGLAKQEQSAYRRLNLTLKEPRYFALLDALDELLADPPLTERARAGALVLTDGGNGSGSGRTGKPGKNGKGKKDKGKGKKKDKKAADHGKKAGKAAKGEQGGGTADELGALLDAAWRRVERAYAAVDGAENVEAARHETRKAAKRARYAAEAARPVLGDRAARMAVGGEHVQEILGGYQDGVIAADHLRSIADRISDPREAFVVGVLYGIEHAEAEAARAKVEETWHRASTLGDL